MTNRQPDPAPGAEPERGFVLAAPPKGVDPVLAELRELSRTAGVEPVAELVVDDQRLGARALERLLQLLELALAHVGAWVVPLAVLDELGHRLDSRRARELA